MRKEQGRTLAQMTLAANTPMMLKAGLVEGDTDAGVLASGQVVGVHRRPAELRGAARPGGHAGGRQPASYVVDAGLRDVRTGSPSCSSGQLAEQCHDGVRVAQVRIVGGRELTDLPPEPHERVAPSGRSGRRPPHPGWRRCSARTLSGHACDGHPGRLGEGQHRLGHQTGDVRPTDGLGRRAHRRDDGFRDGDPEARSFGSEPGTERLGEPGGQQVGRRLPVARDQASR